MLSERSCLFCIFFLLVLFPERLDFFRLLREPPSRARAARRNPGGIDARGGVGKRNTDLRRILPREKLYSKQFGPSVGRRSIRTCLLSQVFVLRLLNRLSSRSNRQRFFHNRLTHRLDRTRFHPPSMESTWDQFLEFTFDEAQR